MFSSDSPNTFWLVLVLVNVSFFLVPYVINIKHEPNPVGFLFKKRPLKSVLLLPYVKNTSDPFKINFEYTCFVFLASIFGAASGVFFHIGAAIGVFTFVMVCYYSVIVHVFQKPPFLKGDIVFAKVGLSILDKYKILVYVAVLILLGLVYLVLYKVTALMLSLSTSTVWQAISAILISILGLYKVHISGYRGFQNRTVLSLGGYLLRNLEYSNRYHFLTQKDQAYFDNLNIYSDVKLAVKPVVNILCIESYGSLYYRNPAFAEQSTQRLLRYEKELTQHGYYVASGYSRPPQFAGGSWKSYSSLNFGIKLLDDGLFFTLFNYAKGFDHYQSLQGFLRSQGYYNYALAALQPNKEEKVDWDHIKRSFDSHRIIDWDSIDYKGKTIKFFKVRNIAPDQYALHKAQEIIDEEGRAAYSLFNISLNSHYPFQSPETLVKDWKTLQEVEPEMITKDLPVEERYAQSIQYQLDNSLSLINSVSSKEGVHVVFGDHQPPFITDEKYGFETPIHIIAKQKKFLEPFLEQGFQEGMTLPEHTDGAQINHEGFLSLFMQGLNKTYGREPERYLPYLPDGVIFKK